MYRSFSPPATVTNSAAALFSSPSANPSTSHHDQPAEVFRKDLISAMKLPDSHQLHPENYMVITDTWKMEWEKGVQVPVNPHAIPDIKCRELKQVQQGKFKLPKKYVHFGGSGPDQTHQAAEFERDLEDVCQYDLDDMDHYWLEQINNERLDVGHDPIDESQMEQIIEEIEEQCHKNMEHAMATEEGLGIEYDEDVICDVCRAPDCEEGNEMVFCDNCDICVHQACYGIVKIPEGNWMCRACALGLQPQCLLCGKKGGAMKSTRSGTKWAHVSCALWIPEVSIGCVERMEPVTKISQIPSSRWSLICQLCRVRTGACIQCSVRTCKIAYHVTCGFENSLDMKTFLDDNTEVRFRSFCLKHSKKKQVEGMLGENTVDMTPQKSPIATPKKEKTNEEKANERAIKIQYVTEEFYKYAKAKDVGVALGMKDDTTDMVDQIYEYWKLKRKAGFNKPLVVSQKEVAPITGNEEYNLHARMRMFVHLRQDLERVRNLCYMVQKREKLSKQMGVMRQAIFYKQCDLFNGDTSQYSQADLSWALRAIELSNGVPRDAVENSASVDSEGGKRLFHPSQSEPKDDESDRSSTSSGSRDSSPDSSSRSGSSAHSGSERNSRESSPRSRSSRGGGSGKGKDNNNSGGNSGKGGDNVESRPNEDAVDTIPTLNAAVNSLAQNNNNNLVPLRHSGRNAKRKLSMGSEETLPSPKRHEKNGAFKSDYARKFEEYLQSVANVEELPRRTTRQSASTIDTEIDKTHNTRLTRQESTLREMQLIEEADKVHAQLTGSSRKRKRRLSPVKSDSDSEVLCVSPPRPRRLGLSNLNIGTPTQEDERSCQSTPETRSARRRIEEELDRESECSDRQFENIDKEISMCFLDSNENTKDGRSSPLASPLVARITRQSKQQERNKRSRLSLRRSENCELPNSQVSSVGNDGGDGGESRKYGIRNRLADVAYRVFNSAVGL
ncbi:LOW QUALITY PROTEIN: protein Jade-3-like [Amphiura filiformis]|uniref:LOW QUALITY PROTEIN: protein Jade-3-like n=1 Tax=Amphiura filiformis TaxID=82378 RepID=UPI003B21343F